MGETVTQLQIPTGPVHTFRALPYPLPDHAARELVFRASDIASARARIDGINAMWRNGQALSRFNEARLADAIKHEARAVEALHGTLELMREEIGVDFTRREFLPRAYVEDGA